MRKQYWLPAAVCLMVVGGCSSGGGGSGVSSTPTPTPAPAPTNTSFSDLRVNQSFTANNTTANVSFDLTPKTTISGTAGAAALTISYDAASRSYTVATVGRSQVFTPGDVSTTDANQTTYRKTDGTNRDYLTLVKVPYTGTTANQYVQLGYWQRNVVTGTRQDTQFDTFTFGFDTPATGVPHSGSVSFNVDAFGLVTTPGIEPVAFQGQGGFDADFLTGVFSTHTWLTETGLLTGNGESGGGIDLTGAGHLSSSDGSFSGNMLYEGFNASIGGTMSGRFYGPAAQELGASFGGAAADGSSFNGAFTGQRDTSAAALNQTLTNLVAPQLFYTSSQDLYVIPNGASGTVQVRTTPMISQLNRQVNGDFTYGPGTSDLPNGTFTAASQVASADPNFIAYDQTINGQDVRLSLYKPGSGNTELALTYASFGRWSSSMPYGVGTETDKVYFTYGLTTPARLLSGRTGSAHYAGVVYGGAENATTQATYDVTGTSHFDVDFSHQNYTGGLALHGAPTNGATAVDFGNYDFTGSVGYLANSDGIVTRGGSPVGDLTTAFYGPNGEEIGGPFTVRVPVGAPGAGTTIAGVTVAKR
ncbi:MAG: transferrin-binding protein-like solute binding protein [Sphingomonas sp.]